MNLTRARTAYHWDHAIFTFFLVPVSSVVQVNHRLQRNRENERKLRRVWTLVPWVEEGGGREGGGREVYEGEFFCETVFAFENRFFRQALWTNFWQPEMRLSLALLDEHLVSTFIHGLLFTVIDYHVCVHKVHESCWWFPKLNNTIKSCC